MYVLNDWISSNDETCVDNYNYFRFKLKGNRRSESWEVYRYGDQTIKVDRDRAEVLPKGAPPLGIDGVGFGPSLNLAVDHIIYELCLPSECDTSEPDVVARPATHLTVVAEGGCETWSTITVSILHSPSFSTIFQHDLRARLLMLSHPLWLKVPENGIPSMAVSHKPSVKKTCKTLKNPLQKKKFFLKKKTLKKKKTSEKKPYEGPRKPLRNFKKTDKN